MAASVLPTAPHAAAPPSEVPDSLVDSLGCRSPIDALLALADESERLAAGLASGLAASLERGGDHRGGAGGRRRGRPAAPAADGDGGRGRLYPVPLPRCLLDAPRPREEEDPPEDGTARGPADPSHALTHAGLAAGSILSSLSRIASGGSAASSEMRSLESRRRALDAEADDVAHALAIREGCARGASSLSGRRHGDAARAVADVDAVLGGSAGSGPGATERAVALAGREAMEAHARTTEVLRGAIRERYEGAVAWGDVGGLSELTPLLGMLGMEELGVKLYLQYSQSILTKEMSFEVDLDEPIDLSGVQREEGMSRAAMRRKAEQERVNMQNMNVPSRLARIYNAAVTHLRHHLPMVAYALGDADGDAALVQLVHVEAERRAVDIMRDFMEERRLGETVRRAGGVAGRIEERYTSSSSSSGDGEGLFGGLDETNLAGVMGLGQANTDIASKRALAQRDDCGFASEVGNLADVDASQEEWALVMQSTESYERFIRHAVEEVCKARRLRREQRREERRRLEEAEEAKGRDAGDAMAGGSARSGSRGEGAGDEDDGREDRVDILPPHTALNEVAAEIGGYYSSLERCLLLAGMQRAFIQASYPDDSTFARVAVGSSGPDRGAGSGALQTNLVEECLFAARRSTLRAFATGHTGTASAAANVCVDVLGRVLLEVLTRRARVGAALVKPGEGLLAGQAGLGQAALSLAGKGLRGGLQGVSARTGLGGGGDGLSAEETAEELRLRTLLGVARAAANFNDLEVAADYTRRLEGNFLREIDAGYPRGQSTEQLRMCVKGLGGVVEAFNGASARSMEELIATVTPRARQIVNEAVGQDGGGPSAGSAATNFLGSPVLAVGNNAGAPATVLDYDLDDAAFELSQISEGYIGRLCAGLDDLVDPLRVHLVPKLADELVIGILGSVSKRLEAAIRKSKFTPLGAISLDSDIRYLMTFAKDRMDSPELKSNVTLCKACTPLARLNQITLLMNVDDLEDALDLISVSKRKGNWDLKLDDAKTLLSLRVDFEGSKVNDLLQVDDE